MSSGVDRGVGTAAFTAVGGSEAHDGTRARWPRAASRRGNHGGGRARGAATLALRRAEPDRAGARKDIREGAMRYRTVGPLLIVAALMAGCASDVKRQPTELAPAAAEQGHRYQLRQDVQFKLDSGYSRTIRASTEFAAAGRIVQGLVLRPTDTVLTVG